MRKGKGKSEYSFHARAIVLIVLTLFVILAAGVEARYIQTYESQPGQVTSQAFYFTTDLLGDSTMLNESGSAGNNSYAFPDVQSGTYYLYGGGAHDITIKVQNFSDSQRITAQDITYTVALAVEEPIPEKTEDSSNSGDSGDSKSASYAADDVSLTVSSEAVNGTYTLTGGAQNTDEWRLSVKSYTEKPYKDGTIVTVTISGTSPYTKTIQLNFMLYSVDTALRYKVVDSAGSPYAELIITTNVVTTQSSQGTAATKVQPYLTWPTDSLYIDNTNNLTYEYSGGKFDQQDGMTAGNMQISKELVPGESESIYFFKADTSDNYSLSERAVTPSDGKYTIKIEKETGE